MKHLLRKRILQEKFDSPAQEAVLNLLVAAGHLREQFDRVHDEHRITHGQYNVLRILKGAYPEGYARRDITRRMLERAPDVTRLIDRLEKRGLVERIRDRSDRRLSVTRITPEGMKLLDTMRPRIDQVHIEISKKLSPRNCEELSRICELLYGDAE